MSISRDLFDERVSEINIYFEFLFDLINKQPKLLFPLPIGSDPDSIQEQKVIPIELTHTLKANGFLLLYNLIESTINSVIEEIHDELLVQDELELDSLVSTLSAQALTIFKKGGIDALSICEEESVGKSLLKYWLSEHQRLIEAEKNPLFSGNVDARKIRSVAEMYGFNIDQEENTNKKGAGLQAVKIKRNQLAHGKVAFRECGRQTSIEALAELKENVIFFLQKALDAAEQYLSRKLYLKVQQ